MTPKQLHILCDFFLLFPLLGILLSVFFFTNQLDKEMHVVKEIFSSWKKKPIHILQDSYQKTCEDIGMNDIVSYEWPGTIPACFCAPNVSAGKCNEREHQLGCKSVEEVKQYRARKWKTRYLCSSSIKSNSYFELNKVKASDSCAYKYKKCGVIDTLGNHLCVLENENCPLNWISFLNTVDEQHVRIDTSNSKENGKIFTNFFVAEDRLCLNHIEREFNENGFKLINSTAKYLTGCRTYINFEDAKSYNFDKNFEKIDSYPKKLFYEHNNIFPFVSKNVPTYPTNLNSNVSLYASVFAGWKRECDKKEFNQFKNNDFDSEIKEIIMTTDDYNMYLIIYSLAVFLIYVLGIVLLKYSKILNASSRIEITNSTLILIVILYTSFTVLYILLYYIADVNLDAIRNAKLTNDFFELLSNNNCSDNFTNAVLKNVSREFFTYANRYFNIKILSVFSIMISLFVLCVTIFAKPNSEARSRRRGNYYYKAE